MRSPHEFDACYRVGRDRLLLQTFALTGDLASAQAAVERAYAAAWRRRRRLARAADPEEWVRRRAWRDAERRDRAGGPAPDHRRGPDRVDPVARATLDALGCLTPEQRRVLVLAHLTPLQSAALARAAGLDPEAAWRALRAGTAAYAERRGVPPTRIPVDLAALATVTRPVRLHRGSTVRRAGTRARRRVVGAVAAAPALTGVVAGAVALQRPGLPVDLSLGQASAGALRLPSVPSGRSLTEPLPPDRFEEAELLTSAEAGPLARGERWRVAATRDRVGGPLTDCQQAPSADPEAVQSLARELETRTRGSRPPVVTAAQTVQLSSSRGAARTAYDTVLEWYAGCTAPRFQLLSVYAVDRVGDRAHVLVLRRWGRDAGTLAVALARSGRVVTTVVRRGPGAGAARAVPVRPRAVAGVLAEGVDRLCPGPGGAACAGRPRLAPTAPPAVRPGPGLLAPLDLPQAGERRASWRATEPAPATSVPAAFACDDTDFSARPVRRGRTRTFVVVDTDLPAAFGLTQNAGTLPSVAAARRLVGAVRARMAGCEDVDEASSVRGLADLGGPEAARRLGRGVEVSAWRVTTEVADGRSVGSLLAIVRRGDRVAQLGFVTAPGAGFGDTAFVALAERAAQRLADLPAPRAGR